MEMIQEVVSLILALSIICGQLIKIPVGVGSGAIVLDLSVLVLDIWGLWILKFRLKRPNNLIGLGLIFILVGLISLFFSPLQLSLNQLISSSLYSFRFFIYILFGWEIYSGVFEFLKDKFLKIFSVSGIILAVLGLLQFVFSPDLRFLQQWGWDPHYFRTVSTFLDPNFLGCFLVITLLIMIQNGKMWSRTFLKILFLLTYLALITTFSRSTYLMFSTSFLVFSFLSKSKKVFLLTFVLGIGLIVSYLIYRQTVTIPRNISRENSANFRINTWEQGLAIFQKSPILGVGYNSYRYGIEKYHLGSSTFLSSHGSTSNDSSLLFVLATTGILGLLIYLDLLFKIFKLGWGKSIKVKNFVLLSGMTGLMIHSIFNNSLFYPPILLWIITSIS